jgi:hypothetical protein
MITKLTAKDFAQGFYEANLVEAPTLHLFASLGWETANLYHEVIGPQGTEGRESEHEVILRPRLLVALKKLNPGLPDDTYTQAIEQLTADRTTCCETGCGCACPMPTATRRTCHSPSSTGTIRKPTIFILCSNFGCPAICTAAAAIWSASSMACRCC